MGGCSCITWPRHASGRKPHGEGGQRHGFESLVESAGGVSHAETGTDGGPTESPFVVAHNGKYYLFVCTNHDYNETAVYESDTPFHWDAVNLVGKFPAHAAEVIATPEEKWYVSRAGWGEGGVYLAEFTWER